MKICVASVVFFMMIAGLCACTENKTESTVKVGLLHSLTGTMAISEEPVCAAELLAIEEINQAGGVLGKQIEVIQEDGESEASVFEKKARKLLYEDDVVTVFGCWTSDSRKAVKPLFEEKYGLLWYPVQYEGFEASPNIMYMGAAPNQQVVPAIDFCAENYGKRMFLLGSDYVFPQTANKIIKAQLSHLGGECVGEEYTPFGQDEYKEIIEKIKDAKPDVIVNTLNGDSNIAFFRQLYEEGIRARDIPVISFSIAEQEIERIGIQYLQGHLLAWNYFETTDTYDNRLFISKYKKAFGLGKVTGDPIEAGYIAVHLWAKACEKAGTFDVEAVRIAAKNLSYDAPEGKVMIDGGNQHLCKTVRIGKISGNGMALEIWSSASTVKPDPYLSTYAWARGL